MSTSESILTCDQIRAVDRLATEEYGIPGVVLMENAGAGAARILLEHAPRVVTILCGPGNNGGDGYVVARHLANANVAVRVVEFAAPDRLRGDAAIMRGIAAHMAAQASTSLELFSGLEASSAVAGCDWIVDGLLGTGFHGEVREPLAAAIRLANQTRASGVRILALDLPSGLDGDSGLVASDAPQADITATFAAKKRGLLNPSASGLIGELLVVSIGVPIELLERVQRQF